MHNESGPFLVLMALLVVKMMLVTNEGQELHWANLSSAMKNLIINENTTVHPAKAQETMSWTRRSVKFLSHP